MTDPTQVLVTVVTPGADGQDVPLAALTVRAHLYRAEAAGQIVRTVGAHSVALDATGHAVLHLSPTDLDQAWNLRIDGVGIDRWVRVPTSTTPVDWDTLADVDPATLEVAAAPATWQALQDRIVTLEGGELSPDAVGTAVATYLTEHPVTGGSSITSVQVTGLSAGASPTASLSAGVLSLGIPAGAKGDAGNAGDPTTVADGAIPQVKVANLVSNLSGKAASSHQHTTSDISNLSTVGYQLAVAADPAAARSAIGAAALAGAATASADFLFSGTVVARVGTIAWRAPFAVTIVGVTAQWVSIGTTNVTPRVNAGGSSLYAPGAIGNGYSDPTLNLAVAAGTSLTVDVIAVTGTVSDLVIQVWVTRA